MFMHDCERAADAAAIETLLDKTFGPDRLNKASYSLRQSVAPIRNLSMVVRYGDKLAATIRFWPVTVRDLITGSISDALLLGPLAVDPDLHGTGLGSSLVERSLEQVDALGHDRVLLVGDVDYYQRFGFLPVLPSFVTLPGGKDARRLLVRQSAARSSMPAVGRVEPWQEDAVRLPRAEVPLLAS